MKEITIQIINDCQLKCKWCARYWVMQKKLDEIETDYMKTETFKKVVDMCHEYGVTDYNLTPTMGELLLDPELYEKLDYLNRFAKRFFFTTNLLALRNISPASKLLSYEKLDLGISVYGDNAETYLRNTNVSCFVWFLSNVKLLFKHYGQEKRPNLTFYIRFPKKFSDFQDGFLKNTLRILNKHYGAKIDETEMYNYNWGGLIPYGGLDTLKGRIRKVGICPTAASGCILHNGDFALCYMNDSYKTTVIDNVFKHTLEEIYNSEKYKGILELQSKNIYEGICKRCNERW